MPERRSPRKLHDISHLYLSGAAGSRSAAGRSTVRIWIAVVGASLNRAHCAAGTAAALARQGMCVSLLEVCRGLPNIGYYFGMEPASYIGPTLDRAELVSGTWNGAIRYCFSADPAALERCGGEDASPPAFPHAIVEAFPYPREGAAARFLATLERAAAAVSDGEGAAGCPPDAIIAAGCGGSAGRARALTAGMRDAFPHAAIFLVTDEAAAARPSEADESLLVSDDLRTSWAMRTPPVDHLFDDLAAGILQVVSQRRKRGGDHAANE